MNGKAVQLIQGEKKALEEADIDSLIEKFKPFKQIQLIDLDAAKGEADNINLIKEIIKKINCRVGGGIRPIEKAKELIDLDAKKVIISSSVFKDNNIDFDFLKDLNKTIGKNKIIIALDTKKEEVVIKGWRQGTGINIFKVIKELEPYCDEFLCTYVDKEGMLQGTNLDFFKKLRNSTTNDITAAGGITTLEEIKELEENNINSALGMAIYKEKIDLKDLKQINSN
ncbi:MAG: HisA/HisF-related TIM barrel protein [Candidatus Woesearchaeota archaeon]|nr:HisA/HisF-related TIM barrel protein [Candidatus Woesearchaeota archaeon]